jgi:hypothetical protein
MNKYIFVLFLFFSLNKGISQNATLTKDSIIQITIPFELTKNKIEFIIEAEPIIKPIEDLYCKPCGIITYRNFNECVPEGVKRILKASLLNKCF